MLDVLFDGKEIGADAGVVEYLEKKGIEHSLPMNARAMVKKGIASLQPVHTKRYEKNKALIRARGRLHEGRKNRCSFLCADGYGASRPGTRND